MGAAAIPLLTTVAGVVVSQAMAPKAPEPTAASILPTSTEPGDLSGEELRQQKETEVRSRRRAKAIAESRTFSTILKEAIQTTFINRKTKLLNRTLIYSDEFINDPFKNEQWKAFLRRMDINIDLSFQDC